MPQQQPFGIDIANKDRSSSPWMPKGSSDSGRLLAKDSDTGVRIRLRDNGKPKPSVNEARKNPSFISQPSRLNNSEGKQLLRLIKVQEAQEYTDESLLCALQHLSC